MSSKAVLPSIVRSLYPGLEHVGKWAIDQQSDCCLALGSGKMREQMVDLLAFRKSALSFKGAV